MSDPEEPDKPKRPPPPPDNRTVIAPNAFDPPAASKPPEASEPPQEDATPVSEPPVEDASTEDPWGTEPEETAAENEEIPKEETDEPLVLETADEAADAAEDDGEKPDEAASEPPADDTAEDEAQKAPDEPSAEAPPTGEQSNSPLNLIGTVINNNYKITALVNAGGMGEVYRGENVHTGDEVAIKIVLPNLAHEEKIITLFRREARILFNLADEAIVRYYNFVKDGDLDRFCLIMEFVDGEPLSERMEKTGPLDLDDTRVLIRRLASGLSRAHALDVTHRDLSPDNVILEDGSVAHAKLIDFGIAKSSTITEGTLHGQFAGKFNFVSPEQLGHYDGIIDGRTDIYGLGLMAAGAARGQALEMGTSIVEAVNSRREIPDLSEIYAEVRPLLSHMLEPDPDHRPATMDDVVAMIDDPRKVPIKYRDGEEDAAVPPIATPPGSAQTTAPGVTAPGISQAPVVDEAESPFGVSMPPKTSGPVPLPTEQTPEKKGGLSPLVMVLGVVVLAAIGGGAYVMTQGTPEATETGTGTGTEAVATDPVEVDKPDDTEVVEDTPPVEDPPPVEDDPPQDDLASAGTGTVDTTPDDPVVEDPPDVSVQLNNISRQIAWVDRYDGGNCVYSAVRASTGDKLAIEGFASSVAPFERLMSAFQREMGSEPDIGVRIINESQCPVLEFVKGMRGNGDATPPILTLDADVLVSGDTLSGRLTGIKGRPVWLFLVSGKGGVFNITSLLERQDDGSSRFGFGMNLSAEDEPTPQMVVAVTSQTPLVTVRAAKAGANASQLLRIVETEIKTSNNPAAATVKYFRLDR